MAIRTSTECTGFVLSQISVKQETCGAGGVYLSSGREKLGFRRVDFDVRPNQNFRKSRCEIPL